MKRLIKKSGKQVGILYHYTNFYHLLSILNGNILKSGIVGRDNISFTRDKNFLSSERLIEGTQCCLVIDGDKLSNDYKIKPYSDQQFLKGNEEGYSLESEEIVKEDISPIIPYIIEIRIFKDQVRLIRLDRMFEYIYQYKNIRELSKLSELEKKDLVLNNIKNYIQDKFGIPVVIE